MQHQRLTRQTKLIKTDEFSSVFDFKKRIHSRYFVLHYKPNRLSYSRIGFVVGKKTEKSAVKRNYMRRVMRELFRQDLRDSALSYDLIIRITRSFNAQSFQEVRSFYLQVMQKLDSIGSKQ